MKSKRVEFVLKEIAKRNGVTVAQVRKEIQHAMDIAMASSDPAVQVQWAMIPKKGEKPTLEEFLDYMATRYPGSL